MKVPRGLLSWKTKGRTPVSLVVRVKLVLAAVFPAPTREPIS